MNMVSRGPKMRVSKEAFLDVLIQKNETISSISRNTFRSEKEIRRGLNKGQMPQDLIFDIARYLSVTPDELIGRRRKKPMSMDPITKQVSVSEFRYMKENEGLTNKEIASRLDIHPATVAKVVGPRTLVKYPSDDTIISWYNEGKSISEMAKEVGCNYYTFYSHFKKIVPTSFVQKKSPEVKIAEPKVSEAKPEPKEEPPKPTIVARRKEMTVEYIRERIYGGTFCDYTMECNERYIEIGLGITSVKLLSRDIDTVISELQRLKNDLDCLVKKEA